jgi:subtilisin family serine protease
VAKGIRYAADNGAKVINMSLGGPMWMPYVQDAIAYAESKGVVVVAAMGNSGKDKPTYPAKFAGVIAVGSSRDGKRSTFSNFGDRIDVSAPGEKIVSTLPDGKYGTKSGTSMSSPYVAGEAALIIAAHPDWSAQQVKDQIERGVNVASTDGWDSNLGFGESNLFKAVYGNDLPAIARVAKPVKQSFWQRILAFFGR